MRPEFFKNSDRNSIEKAAEFSNEITIALKSTLNKHTFLISEIGFKASALANAPVYHGILVYLGLKVGPKRAGPHRLWYQRSSCPTILQKTFFAKKKL